RRPRLPVRRPRRDRRRGAEGRRGRGRPDDAARRRRRHRREAGHAPPARPAVREPDGVDVLVAVKIALPHGHVKAMSFVPQFTISSDEVASYATTTVGAQPTILIHGEAPTHYGLVLGTAGPYAFVIENTDVTPACRELPGLGFGHYIDLGPGWARTGDIASFR